MRESPNTLDELVEADAADGIHLVDWKAGIDDVLKEVDKQLAEHRLEIVTFDTGCDMYGWRISERLGDES